jgi:hypothetical protein
MFNTTGVMGKDMPEGLPPAGSPAPHIEILSLQTLQLSWEEYISQIPAAPLSRG